MATIQIDGNTLTIEDVADNLGKHITLTDEANAAIKASRQIVEDYLQKRTVVYGITTGFGKFKDVYIAPEDSEELQRNFLLSHSAGVGEPFDQKTTRAITLLRANALAKGYSGIRLPVVELLLQLLNHEIHPIIPQQGSVGASGDLAPLSHLALVLVAGCSD